MKSGFWLIGKYKGVPIFVHWTLLLWFPWYFFKGYELLEATISFLAFVFLMLAHEVGHTVAAKLRRVKVEKISLLLLHGECVHHYPDYEEDDVFIAWGGVIAQFFILLFALTVGYIAVAYKLQSYNFDSVLRVGYMAIAYSLPIFDYWLTPILYIFINFNLAIIALNLIPIQPLDGYKAWRIIPLFFEGLQSKYNFSFRKFYDALNFKKRRAMKKNSERVVHEIIERMKKK